MQAVRLIKASELALRTLIWREAQLSNLFDLFILAVLEVALGCLCCASLATSFRFSIGLLIKLVEHPEEKGWLSKAKVEPHWRVVGLEAVNQHAVHDAQRELTKLHDGDVAFPPEPPLHPGPECSQRVVRIHATVHKGIHQDKEVGAGQDRIDLHDQVTKGGHRYVVVQVQKADVRLLLAQHIEQGVEPVRELGYPIPPAEMNFLLNGNHTRSVSRQWCKQTSPTTTRLVAISMDR